ncbi:tRNA-ribosyltransferase [Halorubrum sp. Atlit-8R]|uniref:archaeosine synthase subunit alpha n=1 Tax=unclassified Halorubrum TaxID=2642239 RepID=UPI000EF28649|nr:MULTISPECIES: archaeosine synthase subunit alpha [unclassified Halorubrum]RLM70672.1 tRNA-ribosyltransferase [Halorubrum sp. Atlit-9R]RLM83172.1 tRNA-ribosyltransferase [Halorubrum sp. Atlit-8R]
MTDYFEVHERDGAARLGEVRLADPVTTPALADSFLDDAGSLWAGDREVPDGDESALTVLPHRSFPAGTRDEVRESFAVDHPDADFPSAAVVDSRSARDLGADAYLLSDAQGFVGHGEAFRDAVVRAKADLPPDAALGLAGVATPRNVALLAYAGVDLVDATLARTKGTQGMYLTADAEHFLEDLAELPCACPACAGPRSEFTRADCADHNVNALRAELRRVRERIRSGRLRDYVEGQARHEGWLTAAFREFDDQWGYLEERTPLMRDAEVTAASAETLDRVEIRRFADRVTSRYRNRFTDQPLVLVPCSATKPYSDSQSHRQFHDAIQWRGHTVSMTSPIGVVPQELETTYPAQHYDSVVTGDWSEDEIEFVAEVLRRYLERNDYSRVVAHVPEDGYREICERVESDPDIDVPFEYTCVDHPTTDESLGELNAALQGEPAYSKREREHNTVRGIADFLLGDGAGDDLFGGPGEADVRTTGRYPKLQVWGDDPDAGREGEPGEQLATMVPQYGTLSFTLAGARRWVASDAPTKRVEIDSFVPRGSVLAPGVVDADGDVRVGDEVVVEGPKAFAVGRAAMSGPEMAGSTRGVAVEVRHAEEK